MPVKILSWILVAVTALGGVLLLNYWASYQLLSTLAYAGVVIALLGLANLAIPFRFLGVRRRIVGALIFAGGLMLAFAALSWPASTIHVARPATLLDEVMPEYQFSERHSARIQAQPGRVLQAVRESTFGDMKSLNTLLKVRAAALRSSHDPSPFSKDLRILDAFAASGYISGSGDQEIVLCGGANVRAGHVLEVRNLQEWAAYREPGSVKMAFDFYVRDAGGGWSTIIAETRVLALDDATRRGVARYWRLIVPGSGLLRRQWLDGIKKRAEVENQRG